jgi:hypothetical protein
MGEATAGGREVQEASGTVRASTEEGEGIKLNLPWVKVLNSTYGPYAVGVVSLLVVWFLIVAPELKTNRVDMKSQQEIVDKQRETSTQMERTSSTLKETSTIQERIVGRLERMLDK